MHPIFCFVYPKSSQYYPFSPFLFILSRGNVHDQLSPNLHNHCTPTPTNTIVTTIECHLHTTPNPPSCHHPITHHHHMHHCDPMNLHITPNHHYVAPLPYNYGSSSVYYKCIRNWVIHKTLVCIIEWAIRNTSKRDYTSKIVPQNQKGQNFPNFELENLISSVMIFFNH